MKRSSAGDDGAIVLGWLTKVALTIAVLGFFAYDGISVVTANVSASDRAATLASEAADDVKSTRDVNKAYALIAAEAETTGDTIAPQDFVVDTTGHVQLTVKREATSVWMRHVGPLRKFLTISATGEGSPPS